MNKIKILLIGFLLIKSDNNFKIIRVSKDNYNILIFVTLERMIR